MRPSLRFLAKLGLGLGLTAAIGVAGVEHWVKGQDEVAIRFLKDHGVVHASEGDINAARHARAIAVLTAEGVPTGIIRALAEWHEEYGWARAKARGDDPAADAADRAVDRYNNQVALMIGRHARANGLDRAATEDLVADAFRRGDLIRRLDDPRRLAVPKPWSPRPPSPNLS